MKFRHALPERAGQRGSAMIEMALIFPFYFCLVFGFVQFALILGGYNSAAFAARTAARYAIVHGSTATTPCTATDLQNIVDRQVLIAPASSITVTSTWNPNNEPGSTILVKVSIQYGLFIPYFTGRSITVASASIMTIVQ